MCKVLSTIAVGEVQGSLRRCGTESNGFCYGVFDCVLVNRFKFEVLHRESWFTLVINALLFAELQCNKVLTHCILQSKARPLSSALCDSLVPYFPKTDSSTFTCGKQNLTSPCLQAFALPWPLLLKLAFCFMYISSFPLFYDVYPILLWKDIWIFAFSLSPYLDPY